MNAKIHFFYFSAKEKGIFQGDKKVKGVKGVKDFSRVRCVKNICL